MEQLITGVGVSRTVGCSMTIVGVGVDSAWGAQEVRMKKDAIDRTEIIKIRFINSRFALECGLKSAYRLLIYRFL